jgi:chromate transport protein ChrA
MLVDLLVVILVTGMLSALAINIMGVFGTALLPMSVQQLGNGFDQLRQLNATYGSDPAIAALVSSLRTNMISIVNNQVQGTTQTIAGINQSIQFYTGLVPVIVVITVAGIFIGIILQFASGTYRQVAVAV